MKRILLLCAISAVGLTACARQQFETTPVRVQTSKGVVTCQLYTHAQVTWDQAIAYPSTMGEGEAHNICRQEGHRVLAKLRGAS